MVFIFLIRGFRVFLFKGRVSSKNFEKFVIFVYGLEFIIWIEMGLRSSIFRRFFMSY